MSWTMKDTNFKKSEIKRTWAE